MSAPAVAVSPDGKRFAAAWKDVREGGPRVWWAFASEPKFGDDKPVASEPKGMRDHPSLAADAGGEFWAAWEESRDGKPGVRARRSGPKSAPLDVADAPQGKPAFPVVACGDGLAIVVWEETPRSLRPAGGGRPSWCAHRTYGSSRSRPARRRSWRLRRPTSRGSRRGRALRGAPG